MYVNLGSEGYEATKKKNFVHDLCVLKFAPVNHISLLKKMLSPEEIFHLPSTVACDPSKPCVDVNQETVAADESERPPTNFNYFVMQIEDWMSGEAV